MLDYSKIPAHIRDGVKYYIENGIEPGSFLTAVICNDLYMAIIRADDINRARMGDIVRFFHNEAPSACWRSFQNFEAWVGAGGLHGPVEDITS